MPIRPTSGAATSRTSEANWSRSRYTCAADKQTSKEYNETYPIHATSKENGNYVLHIRGEKIKNMQITLGISRWAKIQVIRTPSIRVQFTTIRDSQTQNANLLNIDSFAVIENLAVLPILWLCGLIFMCPYTSWLNPIVGRSFRPTPNHQNLNRSTPQLVIDDDPKRLFFFVLAPRFSVDRTNLLTQPTKGQLDWLTDLTS